MKYGLVIAAGNQKRFGKEIPKSLAKIGDKTLLDINLQNLKQVCDQIYVVCSYQNEMHFSNYPHITIKSGFGCGDAVMKALEKLLLKTSDKVFIQWGDSIQEPYIYHYMAEFANSGITIPCIVEEKPYVQIVSNKRKRVLFSKYGEKTSNGYHDLSIFYGNAFDILKALKETSVKLSQNGVYINNHGNELNFLDILNETDIQLNIIPLKEYKGFSFNTLEELKQRINSLNLFSGN